MSAHRSTSAWHSKALLCCVTLKATHCPRLKVASCFRRAGLGPDPYGVRRSEQGALAGASPGAGGGIGSMLRSRSHSILPAATRTVGRRRLDSQAGLTTSSEEGIPGAGPAVVARGLF